MTTALVLKYFIMSVPFTLLGVFSGSILYNKIERTIYISIMLWLLVGMGIMMVVTA